MSPVRVCIVNPFQHGGGAEYQISLLIGALRRANRFEVYYLARHVDPAIRPEDYTIVRIGRSSRVPIFGYLEDLVPLYRTLRRLRPQVIYQRVAGGYTAICALYARRHRIPLIWHVAHDTDVMPKSIDRGRNFLRRRLEKWSIEYGIRHADRIVTQTQQQNSLLQRYYGRQADAVIANFHPEPGEQIDKSGPHTVLWIANLKPWKRPEVFVQLAHTLRDLPEVRFIMLGAAPGGAKDAAWRDALLQEISQSPNLKYLGHRSHAEVNELLARATIFVNTSEYEGFPNTFIQAWLRDVVVCSLDVNPDSILDNEHVGIHARSQAALAQAVRTLITQEQLRSGYIEKARRYVRAKHSERNATALVQLIDESAAGVAPQLCSNRS